MKRKTLLIKFLTVFLIVYLLSVVARQIKQSIFFTHKGRVNIVFFSQTPTLISLGFDDSVDYIITFDNSTQFTIPGGYGAYRLGALGRLANLEQDMHLVARAFAWATSSYIDYFFYPRNPTVYRTTVSSLSSNMGRGSVGRIPQLTLPQVFFSDNIETNASFLTRFFLYVAMLRRRDSGYIPLSVSDAGETFNYESFLKKNQGFFYERVFRQEKADVKIVHQARASGTAETLSRILEGEGIRVVGFETFEKNAILTVDEYPKTCLLLVNKQSFKRTVAFLTRSFGCGVKYQETSDVDIIMIPGLTVEEEWE